MARGLLVCRAGDEHVLVLVVHHIAGDGWSMGLLARDLSAAYAARRAGQRPGWAPLPVQYADYALWQRELLGSEDDPDSVVSTQLEYWRQALAGLPEELRAARRPAAPGGGLAPGRERCGCGWARRRARRAGGGGAGRAGDGVHGGAGRAGGAAGPAGRRGRHPARHAGRGRGDAALDDLVGFFVNTLVLRTDVSGDPTLATLIGRARQAAWPRTPTRTCRSSGWWRC